MAIPNYKEWKEVEGYEYDDVIYEKKYIGAGGVAKISINRPKAMNSFTGTTIRHIWECIYDINADPSIGVVILTGTGEKAFCTGGDVGAEAEGEFEDKIFFQCNDFITACKKPIIAVVKGWCVGGGNHLAYCCDFTIAADNARFAQNGPKVGSPATGWPIQYAIRVLGAKKAREMWMLCRRYSADEALKMGLVNSVVPLDKIDEEVDNWCIDILAKSPTCIQMLKASFDQEFNNMRYDNAGDLQKTMFPAFMNSDEQKEAQSAFFEKRDPDFTKFGEGNYETYLKTRTKLNMK
ncbi:MAG TPA: 1,4-dihydroxy-6-naphthoate synthase [Desulfobacteraceae bacterium]|nr:1,4-dihydroxy-6-naphthoate synthase [Desulfobacteraceae bacterium]